jgi:predicted dehydrogenase
VAFVEMNMRTIGIIMHGVTGRMGANQHLRRSIAAIRRQGGVPLSNGERVVPEPLLVGRDRGKLEALGAELGIERITTDLDGALADPRYEIFFDAATTQMRPQLLTKAINAGKHVYCEKPTAATLAAALEVAALAQRKRIKHGVVQDKLFLPGLVKLRRLRDAGFFGRILSLRGEFGYWVFQGNDQPAQRPSWNYRKNDGGGIILDMLCHWRYVIDHIVAPVRSVCCLGANHIAERWDTNCKPYAADADDAAYAMFELDGGAVAQINSSWCTRVYRDDLVMFQVDGTEGSAVAGLHRCLAQSRKDTPRPVWNPDELQTMDFHSGWDEVDVGQEYDNGFKIQWEMFLRHVCEDAPFPHSLLEGAKGVQLAEAALRSWHERRWIDLEDLST